MAWQISKNPGRYRWIGKRHEHAVFAERVLGKPLPKGAQIHHVDGNKANNTLSNLVICQDGTYHALLHARLAVLRMGGNPNTERRCYVCSLLLPMSQFRIRKTTGNQESQCISCEGVARRARYRRIRSEGRCARCAVKTDTYRCPKCMALHREASKLYKRTRKAA